MDGAVADPLPQAAGARPGPARARAAVAGDVAAQPHDDAARDRRRGRRAVGPRRQDRRPADPPPARAPTATRAPAYASSAVLPSKEAYAEEARASRRPAGRAYKIHPPTDPATDIKVCEAVRRAVGDDYTVMLDSTWAYQYPEALRVGKVAEALGFHWYEDPAGRRRSLQLREAQAAAVDPDPGHRVRAGRLHRAGAVDHRTRPPTTCAATSR